MFCDLCGRHLVAGQWFTVTSTDSHGEPHDDRVCDTHLELDPILLVNASSLD